MTTLARTAVVLATLMLLVTGCGDDGTVGSTGESASTFPTVTPTLAPSFASVAAWEQADQIPTDVRGDLVEHLGASGAWMLLPSAAPIEGPVSAEVITLTPGNDPTAATYDLVVRPVGSGAVVLSLSSTPSATDPCGGLGSSYTPTAIRGVEGCAMIVDGGIDFLIWMEDGRRLNAQWDGIDLDTVVAWLETWTRVP